MRIQRQSFVKSLFLFSLASVVFFQTVYLYADHVKSVSRDGAILLESGKLVCLTGLELGTEASQILPALLSKKEVDYEPGDSATSSCGFLYVNTSEYALPYKLGDQPEAKRYMVNELLLKTGAAKVDTKTDFKLKESFLALESTAKKGGQGMWSYEDYPARASRRRSPS